MIYSELFGFICSILRVSPESIPRRRDRCGTVPSESAAETTTLIHASNRTFKCVPYITTRLHSTSYPCEISAALRYAKLAEKVKIQI